MGIRVDMCNIPNEFIIIENINQKVCDQKVVCFENSHFYGKCVVFMANVEFIKKLLQFIKNIYYSVHSCLQPS